MTIQQTSLDRRTVLGSILVGITTGLAGCSALSDSDDDDSSTNSSGGVLQSVAVEGLELVVELERDAVDQLNLIDPSGELFAHQTIESGVSRTTLEIGTDYPIGEYELIGLADEETVETTSTTLEPDLDLTELRMGRDYPEEMYEGASDSRTEAEAILSVTNEGTGPTAVTALRFEGDIPFPTPDDFDESGDSGIYDPENDFGADAESITIPAAETVVIYSNTRPFLPVNARAKCDSVGEDGEFIVRLFATHEAVDLTRGYFIRYSGTDSGDCQLEIEEGA
ncbi:hypothetical protein [Natronosalvus amylolyticus]|uniref:hypothetical protein n=1 Tax=Natronosalvus amylolyticus TaxID=2961994 RepID=UPI0020C9DB6F|nr:hypothetical protein [Natronosalvus amylolyticus]